jgi:N-acetylglutamate synthase-like GNAT family acetyltransferase
MATTVAQRNWRNRKFLGILPPSCQTCGKALRSDSKEICRKCWLQTDEGRAYNQYTVAQSACKIDKVKEAKQIASQYLKELGFVNQSALEESNKKGYLEVVGDHKSGIAGFTHFHHKQNGETMIYSLAVLPEHLKKGWGCLLFYRVVCSAIEHGSTKVVARCIDGLPSNKFYEHLGFKLVAVERGKKQLFNKWEYEFKLPLIFYCADGGASLYGVIAKDEGWRLGFQSEQTDPNLRVEMIDNEYRNYNHAKHLEMVRKHKPLIATALDIQRMEDLPLILKQAREISQYCGRVIIIPKIKSWLPNEYWLGYSIPTSHGGTQIEESWFGNRFVHLLGGSPKEQAKKAKLMNVISLDGNYSMNVARKGKVCWQGGEGRIQDLTNERGCYSAFKESMKRQKEYWHGIKDKPWANDPLFSVVQS